MKYLFIILFTFNISIVCTGQGILRKTFKSESAYSTSTGTYAPVKIIDDRIYIKGFDLYPDSSHLYLAKFDTLFNLVNYVNLDDIDPEIVSGFGDIIKTSDNGVLLLNPINGPVTFNFIKLNQNFEIEWVTDYTEDILRFTTADKVIETDSTFVVFGRTAVNNQFYEIYVSNFDKKGNFIDRRVLFDGGVSLRLDDVYCDDQGYILGVARTPSTQTTYNTGRCHILSFDKSFNLLQEWTGGSWNSVSINKDEDGSIYSIANHKNNNEGYLPGHIIRKINSDYQLEWYERYLDPPFYFYEVGQPVPPYNLGRKLFVDPRGGFYLMGDLWGTPNVFGTYNPDPYHVITGTSLTKITDDGEMEWTYHDTTNYIYPVEAGRLSSGSVVIVGSGYEYNEELGFWGSVLVMIKTDADACEVPGCRLTSSTDPSVIEDNNINVFPNPVIDELNISVADNHDFYKIKLFSVEGKLIRETEFYNTTKIQLSDLRRGVYLVELENQKGIKTTKKIIKE